MSFLYVNGAQLAYRTIGDGPALLAPECNYSWAPDFEALMGRHFTLVVASPRDFGASTRTGAPYDSNLWASDMLSVMRHLGHETFSVFGYSFTGAFGPWLALKLKDQAEITAVASGGFPLLGDYGSNTKRGSISEQEHRSIATSHLYDQMLSWTNRPARSTASGETGTRTPWRQSCPTRTWEKV